MVRNLPLRRYKFKTTSFALVEVNPDVERKRRYCDKRRDWNGIFQSGVMVVQRCLKKVSTAVRLNA